MNTMKKNEEKIRKYIFEGNNLLEKNCNEEAIKKYELALSLLDINNKKYDIEASVYSGIYYSIGKAYSGINNKLSLANYNKAIKVDSKNHIAIYGKGLLLSNELNNYNEAIKYINEAINISSNNIEYYLSRAEVYIKRNMYNNAIDDCIKCLEIDSNYYKAYHHIAYSYAHISDYYKAIKYFKKTIEINDKYSSAYINLGNVYSIIKEYDKALECFNKALYIDESNYKIYNNIGNIYYYKEDYNSAIYNYKKSLDMNNNMANTYCNLGNAYFNIGEINEAIANYKNAIKLNKKYSNAYSNIGFIYYYGNDYKSCLEYFRKSINYSSKNTLNIFYALDKLYDNKNIESNIYYHYLDNIINMSINNKYNSYNYKRIYYKYMSIEKLETIIKYNNLYDDNIRDPDDPVLKLDRKLLKKLDHFNSKINVISLSDINDSILMWSHYSNEHKGVCIEYDFSNIDLKSLKGCFRKVYYSDNIVFSNKNNLLIDDNMSPPEYSHDFLYLYHYKHNNWRYENEYKLIIYNNKSKQLNIAPKIKSIYFGKECNSKEIQKIILSIQKFNYYKDIKLYKMKSKKENLFKLEAEEIYNII
ncbi:tetratricopeptide repeat protein [Brachyspira pilosicoli]|uniref:tetratricopeptide repeat protein n=1 Tax=Brachyspira pilosicoli TaxID=52584 RepID=UPI002543B38E|nr:tetratricopeptide repeat protein [Brachyspira pilosicoli]WIH83374.1 tetratricopeptide repeat protein [Brachyspira pilosicoli]